MDRTKITNKEVLHISDTISLLFLKAEEVFGHKYKGKNHGYTIEMIKDEPWLVGREYVAYEADYDDELCKVTELILAVVSDSYSEPLHSKVFNLANELALAGHENEAAKMHNICNDMILLID